MSTPSTRWFYAGPSTLTTFVGAQWMKSWTRRQCPATTQPPLSWWAGLFDGISFHHSLYEKEDGVKGWVGDSRGVGWESRGMGWGEPRGGVGESRGVGWGEPRGGLGRAEGWVGESEQWTMKIWILTMFIILASVSVNYITSVTLCFSMTLYQVFNGSLP